MCPQLRGAAFLDRDGVINKEVNYLHEPKKTVLLPGVAEALNLIHAHGYLAVILTNQSGIARKMYDVTAMEAVHARLRELLAAEHADFDAVYFCPHHPDYTGDCPCRKPHTGMFDQATRELGIDPGSSFMVGDRTSDVEAGIRAGCRTSYLVRTGYGLKTLAKGVPAGTVVTDNLLSAVRDFFGETIR